MALTQAPSGCATNGNEEKGARQKRPGARSPGGQGEGASCVCVCVGGIGSQPWLLCRASLPPSHTHTAPSLGGGQMDHLWCPSNDPSLDCEGSRACPFQGQVTGEPGARPTLTERRTSQARGESGRSVLGLWGWGRAPGCPWAGSPLRGQGRGWSQEPGAGQGQGVCNSSNSVVSTGSEIRLMTRLLESGRAEGCGPATREAEVGQVRGQSGMRPYLLLASSSLCCLHSSLVFR